MTKKIQEKFLLDFEERLFFIPIRFSFSLAYPIDALVLAYLPLGIVVDVDNSFTKEQD